MTDFSAVLNSTDPHHKIFENSRFLAFLNKQPVKKGHTLIIPKTVTDDLFEIADEELSEMMLFSKKVARALKSAVPCRKIGVMVAGLVVRHAHIHLIPIDQVSDLNFSLASELNDADLGTTAELIRSFL